MDKCCQDKCCLNKCRHDSWNRLRYSGHGQMSSWQMLPGQMSLWQLKSVQDGPRDLTLKFCQNRVSNSWDIANIEFVWVVVGGVQSHFHVQPPTTLRLGCRWVGVVTISFQELGVNCYTMLPYHALPVKLEMQSTFFALKQELMHVFNGVKSQCCTVKYPITV